jgi:hypothetical protein
MFSSKVGGWLAVVAVVLFAALITVQVLELNYYSAAPSAWPVAK